MILGPIFFWLLFSLSSGFSLFCPFGLLFLSSSSLLSLSLLWLLPFNLQTHIELCGLNISNDVEFSKYYTIINQTQLGQESSVVWVSLSKILENAAFNFMGLSIYVGGFSSFLDNVLCRCIGHMKLMCSKNNYREYTEEKYFITFWL